MPFAKVNCKTLYYKDWTPKDGTTPRATLVMSHGLGSSNNYYTAVVPYLTEQGYRCICFDMTGSGLSPYTYVEQSIHSLAEDVTALMDVLSIDKAIFVGHSMSGIVGPELAAEWPDRIQGLILVGPVWPSSEVTPVFEDRINKVAEKGMDVMADTVPYAAVGSKATSLHHAFIRELLLGMDPAGYISLCRVIANAHKSPPKYAKVTCPTLIIAGEEDKSAPLAGCKKIIEALGSSQKDMVVMSKCGHWHCIEDPSEVGKLSLDFLKQIS
ncbi:alpha/beta-hydrolase [Aureobasidium sp. EXF-10727]|nr:alpha/beta-hydrolase [Aureobasidium sp. EXF-10727]KAI4730559.1 alpha/beta-hydrolase [Aureobasidium sp. EXF-10728]